MHETHVLVQSALDNKAFVTQFTGEVSRLAVCILVLCHSKALRCDVITLATAQQFDFLI